MENIELFRMIFKQTHMDRFLYGFAVYYVICCFILWRIDPSLDSFGTALWFGFMIITTIGFGDFTVTSVLGRVLSACLGVYGILLFGFVCGVGASYLFAKVKMGRDESVSQMVYQLEHLDQLSPEHLTHLKEQVIARKNKNEKAAVQMKTPMNHSQAGKGE